GQGELIEKVAGQRELLPRVSAVAAQHPSRYVSACRLQKDRRYLPLILAYGDHRDRSGRSILRIDDARLLDSLRVVQDDLSVAVDRNGNERCRQYRRILLEENEVAVHSIL